MGLLAGILIFCAIAGNLFLITGAMTDDLADNPIAWIMVIIAIIGDIWIIGSIVSGISQNRENARKEEENRRIAEQEEKEKQIRKRVHDLIAEYSLKSFCPPYQGDLSDSNVQNRNIEVCTCYQEYWASVSNIDAEIVALYEKNKVLLNCPGCTTNEQKLDYILQRESELRANRNAAQNLVNKRNKTKICLAEYDVDPLTKLRNALTYTVMLQASLEAKDVKTENGVLKNLLVLITNKANDIPAWFYLQNPNIKMISIGSPSKEEREALVKGPNFPSFFAGDVYMEDKAYYDEHPEELAKIQDRFVALTEGFSFTEINGLRRLCKNERIRMRDLSDVIDLYKYGIRENPWKSLDLPAIKEAKDHFTRRVKGQDYAITKTLDVIKRAITGMSGLQGSSHTRPKGVLFFAGPTGTGKTETAKTLAELLFGDESCCIRFDMSEYSQSHSDQKLLGAPPGYVGYEAGGQLTNAVKKNPFSILLFDEIEKAHPSILDKFLQILEDGRMTDGQGNTVYFSETIIIFTTNLGIYTRNRDGSLEANVTAEQAYPEVSERVRGAIENYFKLELGRPEILNRIGENIVVFDFIRPEVAKLILQSQVDKIIRNLAVEKRIQLTISNDANKTLIDQALGNLANGGRGIGNVVENLLINPLSRYLFDNEIFGDAAVTVDSIDLTACPPELCCSKEEVQ